MPRKGAISPTHSTTASIPQRPAGAALSRLAALVAGILLALALAPPGLADDFGTWQWTTLELYKHEAWSAGFFNELRWIDSSKEFSLALLGPTARYQACPSTSFGVSAFYLHVQRGYLLDDTNQAWLEADMLNTWKPMDDLSISLRTMFENRWLEDPHTARQITRHRLGAAWALHGCGPLTKVFANDEVFYDWDDGTFNENRAIPIGVSFKITDTVNLDVFHMIRSRETRDAWFHEFILGTHLQIRF